ncbi:MAG: endonuclease/exonuclease/phosphatase family protein [Deltaproteobacteria bacterium]|nr:endonuclease/exonuclease/phosphatase family protein [Deltaproteobacteria bacterium]
MIQVSVLSLNLRFGLADDGPNGWGHRKRGVARLFKEHATDFIATQEANDFQAEFLADQLRADYRYIGRRDPAPSFWQNNILFYRKSIACRKDIHLFLSDTPKVPSRSYGSRFPRQATLGLFELHRHPLICIDTHFDFDTPAHMGAVEVLREHLSAFSKQIPVILMGDFNATPQSPCYRRLVGENSDGHAGLGFKETFTPPYPGTFHRFTGRPVAGYIDWILYRGPLRLKTCRVLDGAVDGVYVSDHYPVKALFEWPEGTPS